MSISLFPTSLKQIQANRSNAQSSSGPRTCAGKARSSRNAMRHGIFCKGILLPIENQKEFAAHKIGLLKSLNPRNELELQLVEQVISLLWRLRHRVRPAEFRLYELVHEWLEEPRIRDRTHQLKDLQSQVQYFARELERIPSRRRQVDPNAQQWIIRRHAEAVQKLQETQKQFEQQPLVPLGSSEVLAQMVLGQDLSLQRLQDYERRLEGSMHRCLNQLRQLRKEQDEDEEPTSLTMALLKQAQAKEQIQQQQAQEEQIEQEQQVQEQPAALGHQEPSSPPPGKEDQQEEEQFCKTNPNCIQPLAAAEIEQPEIEAGDEQTVDDPEETSDQCPAERPGEEVDMLNKGQ